MTTLDIFLDKSFYLSPWTYSAAHIKTQSRCLSLNEKVMSAVFFVFLSSAFSLIWGVMAFYLVSGYFQYRIIKKISKKEIIICEKPFPSIYLFQGGKNYLGISVESLQAVEKKIHHLFQSINFRVQRWDQDLIDPANWPKNALVIFPGGKCSEWDLSLTKEKLQAVLSWIQSGGRVLGICAGGYYCSKQSEFQLGVNEKISRIRTLSLFPGICKGPVYSSQLKVVKVRWEKTKQEGFVAVIGGGFFVPDSEDNSGYEVLARYCDRPNENAIAVVKCVKNSGKAILCGPHLEFDSSDLEKLKPMGISGLETMQEQLDLSTEFRTECLTEIFRELARI